MGLLYFEETLLRPLHSSTLPSFVSFSASKFGRACWSDCLWQKKKKQICVPYSVFLVLLFSSCLFSHRDVLWAGATHLEYSVSCRERVTRPGDSIFCFSSHSVKLCQVTVTEPLTCPYLFCSQTSSHGLEKNTFLRRLKWLGIKDWQSFRKQQDLGPILQSPEYGERQERRGYIYPCRQHQEHENNWPLCFYFSPLLQSCQA